MASGQPQRPLVVVLSSDPVDWPLAAAAAAAGLAAAAVGLCCWTRAQVAKVIAAEKARDALAAEIQAAGVREGGVLLVHSSLSALGRVPGGAASQDGPWSHPDAWTLSYYLIRDSPYKIH
jgi:hypothetical protein